MFSVKIRVPSGCSEIPLQFCFVGFIWKLNLTQPRMFLVLEVFTVWTLTDGRIHSCVSLFLFLEPRAKRAVSFHFFSLRGWYLSGLFLRGEGCWNPTLLLHVSFCSVFVVIWSSLCMFLKYTYIIVFPSLDNYLRLLFNIIKIQPLFRNINFSLKPQSHPSSKSKPSLYSLHFYLLNSILNLLSYSSSRLILLNQLPHPE